MLSNSGYRDPQEYSGDELLECLTRNYNSAKSIADLWESLLQACYFYAVPWRNRFYMPSGDFQGDMKNARVYDTTAVEATKTFVSKLQDTMTPPATQWGYYDVEVSSIPLSTVEGEDEFQVVSSLQEAQEIVDDYMRQVFRYIHRSNFDVVINECYYDLAIGTASLVINQGTDKQPLLCTSIPMDKLVIREAANSKIESWYRTWDNLKINELRTRWPNIEINATLMAQLIAQRDSTVAKIYEGVTFFPDVPKTPYLYAVWMDGHPPLLTQWLEVSAGIVWRFQKTNNETWGRGPVMDALPSIISLNEIARIELAAANLNTFKPYMGFSDAVFNPHTFTLEPFSIIPIAPVGAGGVFPLQPLPGSSDPQFAQMTIMDLRVQILKLLYAETPETSTSVQPKTAYELSIKQQQLADQIGPMFSRLLHEFLEPVIGRVTYILHNLGLLPRPKIRIHDTPLQLIFKYKSPLDLSQGQKSIARLAQFIQILQGIFGAQAAQIYINPATTPQFIANQLQIPMELLNSPEGVKQAMQNFSDMQGEMMENQQQQQNSAPPLQ